MAAPVTSDNIVGYTSQTVPNGKLAMIGIQFCNCGTESDIAINDIVPSGVEPGCWEESGDWRSSAPQLQVWNGVSYTFFYYISNAYIEETDSEATGWANSRGDFITDTLAPGQAAWFKAATGDSTVTTKGQVVSGESKVITCQANKLTMVANPYPLAFGLNDSALVNYNGQAGTWSESGDWRSDAPQMQVWDGNTYTFFYYIDNAYVEETDGEATGWANSRGDLATESINVGSGFWINPLSNDFSLTFKF